MVMNSLHLTQSYLNPQKKIIFRIGHLQPIKQKGSRLIEIATVDICDYHHAESGSFITHKVAQLAS